MQKQIIAIIIFIIMFVLGLAVVSVFANETQASRLQYYKPLYVIGGAGDDAVKVQASFKYLAIDASETDKFYIGYSQYMFWDFFGYSSPFTEINYNPEIFFISENLAPFVNYFQFGFWEHKSNGLAGKVSRGIDKTYIEVDVSTQTKINFGITTKVFYSWRVQKYNNDIVDYVGYYEGKIYINLLDSKDEYKSGKEEIYFKFGMGKDNFNTDYRKGWFDTGIKFRIITDYFTPYLFINWFYGYGESLIDYNKKDSAVRCGLILNY